MTYEEIQQILEGYPSGTKVRFSGTYGEIAVANEEAIVEVTGTAIFFHQNVWDNCFMENKYGKKEVYFVASDYTAKNITSLEVVEENQGHHGFKIGDKVEFVNFDTGAVLEERPGEPTCPGEYKLERDGIPRDKLRHGRYWLGEKYYKEKATVEGFHGEWVLVAYTGQIGQDICLGFSPKQIRKVKEKLEEEKIVEENSQKLILSNNPKNIMSKITKFVKDLKLSQKDRLLRKHGLQDECGQPTEDYREILRLKQEEEGYDYVVSVAQQMEDEANKEKKKK